MFKRILSVLVSAAMMVAFAPQFSGPQTAYASVDVSNPRVVTDSSMEAGQRATWDCIWFGSYPQSEVMAADSVYARLQTASWNANSDAMVGGVKYRRISKNDATYSGYWPSDSDAYRYFRYEPIKWRVLSVSGSTVFVVADEGIDCRRYNENDVDVTWATSSVRSWLNGYGASSNQPGNDYGTGSFISTAFSAGEQSAILTTDVVNADNVYYGTVGGANTRDKVFLLSDSEVCGDAAKAHGFASDYGTDDEARRAKATSFANAMGAWVDSGGSYDGSCCWWWLRSPGDNASCAVLVLDVGRVFRGGDYGGGVDYNDNAVRPALKLNLASSYPTGAGTVSSNGTVDEKAPTGQYGSGTGGGSGNANGSGAGSPARAVKRDVVINAATVSAATVQAALKQANNPNAATVTLGAKVKGIKAGAFKGTKVTTLVVKSKKLKAKTVKGSLKGSSVRAVKVQVKATKATKGLKGKKLKAAKKYNKKAKAANKKVVKKYKQIFTKKVAGKKAKVS